jgi:preprotein translocase subunit YajC
MTALLDGLFVLAAEVTDQPAAAPTGATPGNLIQAVWSILPFVLIIIALFWFMNRSQRKRERERKDMLESIKPKDDVVTIGGIYGRVLQVKEDQVVLRVDPDKDIRITVSKQGISRRLEEKAASEQA